MNHWQNEFMAEYRRREILDEAEQIRLEICDPLACVSPRLIRTDHVQACKLDDHSGQAVTQTL